MDTALKHRLTGAILLVLLAVVLLPELLTGAGNAPRAVADVQGDADVPVRRYDIDLTEQAGRPSAPSVTLPDSTPPPSAPPVMPAPVATPAPAAAPPPAATSAPAVPPSSPATQPAPTAQTGSPGPSGYVVQVGVFSNREGAERTARSLRQAGFTVTVSRFDTGQRLYRVRVGPPGDPSAARRLRERLAAAGHSGTLVAEGVESAAP